MKISFLPRILAAAWLVVAASPSCFAGAPRPSSSGIVSKLAPHCAGLEKFYPCFIDAIQAQQDEADAQKALKEVGEKILPLCNKVKMPGSKDSGLASALENYRNGYQTLKGKEQATDRRSADTWNACVMPVRTKNLIKECEKDLVNIMTAQAEAVRARAHLEGSDCFKSSK